MIGGIPAWTSAPTLSSDGIGATPTDVLTLDNATDAAAGAQQYSPALRFHGSGWRTDAPAAAQDVDWRMYLAPVQGAGGPANNLVFAESTNGAAFTVRIVFDPDGHVYMNQGKRLYFDGGLPTGDTYIASGVANEFRIVTGGALSAAFNPTEISFDGGMTLDTVTAGDFTLNPQDGNLVIQFSAAEDYTHIQAVTATINAAVAALIIRQNTSGTAAVGFGPQLGFEADDDAGTFRNLGGIAIVWSNLTGANLGSKILFTCKNNSGSVATPLACYNGDDLKIEVDGGYALKSASATEIGLQVTNGALTVGSEGSVEVPYLSQTGALFTDAIGGNLDGCIGVNYDSDTGPTSTLEARVEGAWLSVALTGLGIQSKVPYHPNSAWVHPAQIFEAEGRQWANETLCVVCGEPLRQREPVMPWVNARNSENDLHALFGHLHLEQDRYFQALETRVMALERALETAGGIYA